MTELTAIAWACGLVAAITLFGYAVAIPGFMVCYFLFGYRRGVAWAAASGAAMWALTYLLVEQTFSVHLPRGILF